MKLEFSQPIFEKYSNINFHENQPGDSRVVPRRQTDRHDETVTFYDFANAPQKKVYFLIDVHFVPYK